MSVEDKGVEAFLVCILLFQKKKKSHLSRIKMSRGGRGRIRWGFSKGLDRKKKIETVQTQGLTAAPG